MSPRRLVNQGQRAVSWKRVGSRDIPGLNEMPREARYGKQHEYSGSCDVGPAQEWILATNPRNRGDDNGFSAFVRLDREICPRNENQTSLSHRGFDRVAH
jgi:hypothetical protein